MSMESVIFDLGGVVLDWAPEPAFERVLPAADVSVFMERIGFFDWNRTTDAGRSFAEAEDALIAQFPADAVAIRAYRANYGATLLGMLPGTSVVLAELGACGVPLAALTNWSGETFPIAWERFGILRRFLTVVVSGDEKIAKPDPAIFALACARAGFDPSRTVFVDDSPGNVAGAERAGLRGLLFAGADRLRSDLTALGLLRPLPAVPGPLHHLVPLAEWERTLATGSYPWSARGIGYEAAGFVHLSFGEQLAGTRAKHYGDLADEDIVELRLAPDGLPVVVEDGYPHLYAPLPLDRVSVHRSSPR